MPNHAAGPCPRNYAWDFWHTTLAYRIQELAYGGLPKATVEHLQAIHDKAKRASGCAKLATDLPAAGTVLVREHEGVRHEVRIIHNGFEYAGKRWKSLSVIAREITGVNWNGPKFFGLRSQRGKPSRKTP
jgi:hypothetical protein